MPSYAAHVRTDLDHATDDELDALVDALAPVAGVPSMLGGRLSVQLTVDAATLPDATRAAIRAVHDALDDRHRQAGVGAVGVEVLTADEFDRLLDAPPVDDLVPTVRAAEILGVSRQRILQLADTHESFPRPVRLGGRGSYWSGSALRRWHAARTGGVLP